MAALYSGIAENLAADISRLQKEADRLGEAILSGQVPTVATRRKLEKVLKEKIEKQVVFDRMMDDA